MMLSSDTHATMTSKLNIHTLVISSINIYIAHIYAYIHCICISFVIINIYVLSDVMSAAASIILYH